jgi:NitT/TauT family transport system substrate-binding protein
MQNRRHFLQTGFSMAAAGLAGAAALAGVRRTLADEAPPETTSLRLGEYTSFSCLAPLYILDDLLHEEGFADIRYVPLPDGATLSDGIARGEVDFGGDLAAPIIIPIDAGKPMVVLAGLHVGCKELFARETIRTIVDLKGKKVGVPGLEAPGYIWISIIAASVGLDPAKDIDWVVTGSRDQTELFANGEIDALLSFPPWAQELHARNFGHVILSSAQDRPWSQYFCCMFIGASEFVRRNPVATKRVVRAMVRANDICAAKPDWVAQRLRDRGFPLRYDYVRQGLHDVPYGNWREFDAEDGVRFYALRMRELGMIKSAPDTIIAKGTDWRFVQQVRKELGI